MSHAALWSAVRRRHSLPLRTFARALSVPQAGPGASVLIANAPGLRVVDLNRPDALNALNGEMVDTLTPLLQDWQQEQGDVYMVVFRGSGERAFCAGGDIRFLHQV